MYIYSGTFHFHVGESLFSLIMARAMLQLSVSRHYQRCHRRQNIHVVINSRIQQCVRGCYSFIFMGNYQLSILCYLTAHSDVDVCGYHLIVIPTRNGIVYIYLAIFFFFFFDMGKR